MRARSCERQRTAPSILSRAGAQTLHVSWQYPTAYRVGLVDVDAVHLEEAQKQLLHALLRRLGIRQLRATEPIDLVAIALKISVCSDHRGVKIYC